MKMPLTWDGSTLPALGLETAQEPICGKWVLTRYGSTHRSTQKHSRSESGITTLGTPKGVPGGSGHSEAESETGDTVAALITATILVAILLFSISQMITNSLDRKQRAADDSHYRHMRTVQRYLHEQEQNRRDNSS